MDGKRAGVVEAVRTGSAARSLHACRAPAEWGRSCARAACGRQVSPHLSWCTTSPIGLRRRGPNRPAGKPSGISA